ncbi:MAG TPA: NAD(P)/FAD-dependent oxidoreductase [Plantibacter sp.]|uniref:phytoene desaturase family protein n=1 Tax=unclassified Plantibacter TaxID=2624265 RepID=UPI002C83CB53|nr:NAD(P)/FAD-dependent oxidoreductase [Plantibacter sp.]
MVDAVVVGSGPNGLAAAVTLARAGLEVEVHEAADTVGGGLRTQELTEPGFLHDICSAIHPMVLTSPFFRAWRATERVDYLIPDASYGHPLDRGRAGIAYRDLDRTAGTLGVDGVEWRHLFQPIVDRMEAVTDFTLNPLLPVPKRLFDVIPFGLRTLHAGSAAWLSRFEGTVAPGMLAGVMAHTITRLPGLSAAGAGLVLGANAHAGGWPVPIGGAQSLADAMVADLEAHGGRVVTGHRVTAVSDLPDAAAVLFDTSPRDLVTAVGSRLPVGYARKLGRFRYGNAVYKIDLAVSEPIPWKNRGLLEAPTVHLGGTAQEIAAAENEVAAGRHAERPYVLLAQPSLFDSSRAPEGKHTVWAYCHVPNGSRVDMSDAIIDQIERFAPGFRDTIIAQAGRDTYVVEQENPNDIGGDISGGEPSLAQLLRRPVVSREPWRTPADGIYLCSGSASPGMGVHGMPGFLAAQSALRNTFRLPVPSLAP